MITALIPARGGSKRIPNKNMVGLGGDPLLAWTVSAALAAGAVENVVVSSDSVEILNLADKLGAVALDRPAELAADNSNDYSVVNHFLANGLYGSLTSLIVYLRPTTPIRRVSWIDEAIKIFGEVETASGLRSVHKMSESAEKCFYRVHGNILETMGGRREVDLANEPNHRYNQTYRPNGAIDIIKPEIVKTGALYGDKCYGYLTPWTIEIDTPADLAYAQYLSQGRATNEIQRY